MALLGSLLVLAAKSRAWRKLSVPLECLRALAMGLPLVLPSILCAQQPEAASTPTPPPPLHQSHGRATLEDRVKVMARNLDLDQAQQNAVLTILQARREETLRLRRDTSISGSDRIDQFRALQDKTVLQIRAVLNDEQKKKYDPLAVRTREPATGQKSVEDWLELTAPK